MFAPYYIYPLMFGGRLPPQWQRREREIQQQGDELLLLAWYYMISQGYYVNNS